MSKARTLLESIAAKFAAQQSGLTATEQQQLQDFEARLAFLNNRIAKALENNRVEVFSAHGYLSDDVPALSSIVLGQVNNPASIDGYITAGEWTGYNLKSDLMVFSACQTGLGEVVGGEGVMLKAGVGQVKALTATKP